MLKNTLRTLVRSVFDKLRNKFQFPEESIQELIDILMIYCHVVDVTSKFDIVRDKKDNKIVECAFDGKADYIVTGDPDLLVLKEFKGIKIVKAKDFLEMVR
ncbi:putative toxin-antitoxin system toxin component, PIN family [Candidatus Woesearchaeota archaeon]|nr:putative toxin-antitoxin system toxin component, PIN family [Candidatus Woesearchaeota archaeon]